MFKKIFRKVSKIRNKRINADINEKTINKIVQPLSKCLCYIKTTVSEEELLPIINFETKIYLHIYNYKQLKKETSYFQL